MLELIRDYRVLVMKLFKQGRYVLCDTMDNSEWDNSQLSIQKYCTYIGFSYT